MALPVTFTDGTQAELVYPSKLDIAGLGGRPYGSGTLRGDSPTPGRGDVVGRDFWIFHGEVNDVLVTLNGRNTPRLLAEYEGVGQKVGFWDLRSDDTADYLAFQFGRWVVLVYDHAAGGTLPGAAMTDAERAAWAASFSGRETRDGFLLLQGSEPLRLARAGEHAGPEFSFGSVEPHRSLTLYPGPCSPHRDQTRLVEGKLVQWTRGFADWCLPIDANPRRRTRSLHRCADSRSSDPQRGSRFRLRSQRRKSASAARWPNARPDPAGLTPPPRPGGMFLNGAMGSSNLGARFATGRRLVMQRLFDYRASGRAV